MSETSPAPPKPGNRRWLRRLAYAAGSLVVVLGVAYFVGTSSAFFRAVILPRVSKALNATVTVEQASIHPFSKVVLRGLKVQTTGTEPLLSAPEVRVRYSLWSILRGTIRVEEVLLDTPVLSLVQQADGSSNTDPILRGTRAGNEPAPKKPEGPSAPVQIDVRKVAVQNATLRLVQHQPGGGRILQEVSGANLTLSDLKNGQTGKADLSAGLRFEMDGGESGTNAAAAAVLTGAYSIGLGPDLMLSLLQGQSRLVVGKASGAVSDWANLQVDLVCEVSPTELSQVAFTFKKGEASLGEISLAGLFDPAKMEGQVGLVIRGIDRRLLSLVGGASGWDFGSTRLSSTNQIGLAKGGTLLTTVGRFEVAEAVLKQGALETPLLDLRIDYDVAVDQSAGSALVRALTLEGAQNRRPVLRASLTAPMQIAWANKTNAIGDSRLGLVLTNFSLADWKPFLREWSPEGEMDLVLELDSRQAGQQLAFALRSRVAGLSAALGTNRISQAEVSLTAQGQAKELKDITVTGQLALNKLTGSYGAYAFQDYGTALDLEAQLKDSQIDIRKAVATITAQNQPGGRLRLAGNFDLSKNSGRLTLGLEDLNEHALRPFLESMLAGQSLVSVSLQGTNTVQIDSRERAALRSEMRLTKFVLRDPKKSAPEKPLEARWSIDAQLDGDNLDLRPSRVGLSPTPRAPNDLDLKGRLGMAQPEAWEGQFSLAAAALDLTPFYDLVAGQPAPTNPPAQLPQPPTPPTEPAPVQLPCRHLTLDARIGHLYLGDLDLAGVEVGAIVESNRVRLNPFVFRLNDRPVTAALDLDLGVPGYVYDAGLRVDNVQLTPLVNTFNPEYRNTVHGEVLFDLRMKGAGLLEASLRKNLSSHASFGLTNANLNLLDMPPLAKPLQTLLEKIGVQKALEFLTRQNAAQLLVQSLRSSWMTNSPLQWMAADLDVQQGILNVPRLAMLGGLFSFSSQGRIPLQTNALSSVIPNIPIQFALHRSIAETLRLVPAGTPPETKYILLPDFYTLGGTLANPQPTFDKTSLLKAGLQKLLDSGEADKARKKLDELVPGASQMLDLNKVTGTNAPPGSNTVDRVLRNLGGLLGGEKTRVRTNAPPPGDGGAPKPPRP